MTPDVQRGLAIALVLVAAIYLARRSWRHRRNATSEPGSGSCGPGCGCG